MSRTYDVNGQEMFWQEVIALARSLGLKNSDGFYTTSMAAAALREHGYTVTDHAPAAPERTEEPR
jgi:hypothetical protein